MGEYPNMHENNINDIKLKESNLNEQINERQACRELSVYVLVFYCLNYEYKLIVNGNDYL